MALKVSIIMLLVALAATETIVPSDNYSLKQNVPSNNPDCIDKTDPIVSGSRLVLISKSLSSKEGEEKVIDNSSIRILNWSTWLRFFEGFFLFLLVEIIRIVIIIFVKSNKQKNTKMVVFNH